MNKENLVRMLLAFLATTTIIALGSSGASGQATLIGVHGQAPLNCRTNPNAIVGSWLIQLGNGNRILQTFTSDRTIVEAGQGDIVAPFQENFPSFTAGHGAWTCDADGNWVSTVVIVMYDVRNPFVYLGQFKSHEKFALSDPNNLSGPHRLDITLPDGSVIDGGSTGTSNGKRVLAEPF